FWLKGFCTAKSWTTGELVRFSPRICSVLLGPSSIPPVVAARCDIGGLCVVESWNSVALTKLSVGDFGASCWAAGLLEKAAIVAFLRSIKPLTADRDLERFRSCLKLPSVGDLCES